MADKSTQVVLAALSRAAADPAGMPLYGSKTQPGLFAATAQGKQAAQRCKDEGYLTVLRTEARGRGDQEICSISDRGLAFLLGQTSPRQVLEDFLRVLEARQSQLDSLVTSARQIQAGLDALRTTAEQVLHRVLQPHPPGNNGTPPTPRLATETWIAAALEILADWQESGASEDCPLPELCRQLQTAPGLTIGRFHDGLRRLYDEGRIYLHPWTGPLHDLPEPPYALLVGHEIAYYASLRR